MKGNVLNPIRLGMIEMQINHPEFGESYVNVQLVRDLLATIEHLENRLKEVKE